MHCLPMSHKKDARLKWVKEGFFRIFNKYQNLMCWLIYSLTYLKEPFKKKNKIGFQCRLSLNAGQKHCRMLQESILQYFQPSLSYHLPIRPLFCLFLSACLRQVLLHIYGKKKLVYLPFMPVMSGSVSPLSCSLTAVTAAETGKEVEGR